MNDAGERTDARKVNARCVDILAKALAEAKRGEYTAAAIIAVDHDGKPYLMFGGAGGAAMAVYFGAGMLQDQLMAQSTAPSSILKPGQLSS